jgi:hypothetical protein
MRPLLYALSALFVMALAFWAYRENYATQAALRDLARTQDDIAGLREDIAMQRAEWAYLNRPSRLKDLATVNFDRLQLLPLEPSQLADGKTVAYPLPQAPDADLTASTGAPDAPRIPAIAAQGGKLVITGSADTSGAIAANPDDKAFP